MSGPLLARVRLYLRFAATLFAAIAASAPLGISNETALFLLPLTGASLGIAVLARLAAPLPVLAATLALVASLIAGISALLWNLPMLALSLAMIAGLAIIAVAIQGAAILAGLAGVSLLASSLALLEQGAGTGFCLLAAATLIGLVRPDRREKKSALAIQQ